MILYLAVTAQAAVVLYHVVDGQVKKSQYWCVFEKVHGYMVNEAGSCGVLYKVPFVVFVLKKGHISDRDPDDGHHLDDRLQLLFGVHTDPLAILVDDLRHH